MDEKEIKGKLTNLAVILGEVSNMITEISKFYQQKVQEKTQVENSIVQATKKLNEISLQIASHWSEFELKKKSADVEIERRQKESEANLSLSEQKLSEQEKLLEKAKKLEGDYKDKLVEVEKIRVELADKKEKARILVSQI